MKVIIIDDEPDSISLLSLHLKRHCPKIEIVSTFSNAKAALEEIKLQQPDLLFLDVEMPEMNGFDFMQRLMPLKCHVIFITAYNQYAIKAFRFNALDYLLKPIEISELMEAVAKAEKTLMPTPDQLGYLQKQMQGSPANKLAIPSHNGISFINLDEIIYGEANNNYTKLFLTDGKCVTFCKTLKEVQDVLEGGPFLRIHRHFIINLNYVTHFNRNDSIITMNNLAELPIARSQKEKLIEKYRWL